MTYHPLTPALAKEWRESNKTMWFRDARGQVGFGTWDLAVAMKLKPVEVAEL